MKKAIIIAAALLAIAGHAQAQTTSTAQQTSNSAANSFGTLNMSQSPADQHLSETIRNVSAPVLGAFAPNMSPLGCTSTAQGGAAIAGVSVVAGAPVKDGTCELEVSAAELSRQAFNSRDWDPATAKMLNNAAVQIRCRVNAETYEALKDSGIVCKREPAKYEQPVTTVTNSDGQQVAVRYVPVYDKAQP